MHVWKHPKKQKYTNRWKVKKKLKKVMHSLPGHMEQL